MRASLTFVVVAALLLGAAAPAAPPDYPVAFITVDELKRLVDGGAAMTIIDVRTRPEYDELHIRGARSIPLRNLPERTREIPKAQLVVFY
ncbi:MAG: rhodanese-like domain-containing protein [Candidatus Rokuibacteriota bacterium]